MKKIYFLIIAVLFIIQNIFSQTIIDENMNWSVWEGYYPPSGGSSLKTKLYKIEGDTLINTYQYKILKSSYDSSWTNIGVEGAIRLDSAKKVYFHKFSTDFLLYDFNLNKNDTFIGSELWSFQTYTLVVDSVDSVMLENGSITKRIIFKDYNTGYPVEYWLEEVGSNFGLLASGFYIYMIDFDFELLCCKRNSELLFENSTYNKCFLLPLEINENTINGSLSIFPNPTTGKFLIKNEESRIKNVSVYDIYGREVGSPKSEVRRNEYELDLSQQPKGIYIIKVQTERGIMVEKVILE